VEFYVDRNLGRYDFPDHLRDNGLIAHAHDDLFPQSAPDEEWIPIVAERGWIILSEDKDIMRTPLELAAVMLSGAQFFCLVGKNATASELARNFVNTLPKISDFINNNAPPYIVKVYRPNPTDLIWKGTPGSLTLTMDYPSWLKSGKSKGFR
jgi:predicted nuclease of predicted toxin-antitoxin system